MKLNINHNCTDFDSYRSARVKSLFNVESGANVHITADLPIEGNDWQIGVIVGGSGTGKTSIGKRLWRGTPIHNPKWDKTKPVIDQIATDGSVDDATTCLSAVGLGTVPAWLRPYHVLSNGEQFRANLARALADAPKRHPDWVYDTSAQTFERGSLWQRPTLTFDIYQTDWRYWHLFEPHHYLKMPKMIAATNYVAVINGELVAHLAVFTRPGLIEARACRLVVMPEWQGAGIGMRFLNQICEHWLNGENRYNKPMRTIFHTSHPN